MTGKQRALIFVIAGLCGLGGIAAFGWIMWRTFTSVTKPTRPTAADRGIVLTADKLLPLGIDQPNPDAETLVAIRNFDGSVNIEYEYSSSRDPHAESFLSVSSSVLVFPNSLSAIQTFKMQQIALKAGTKLAKLKIVDMPQLTTLGDQRYAALMERDGEPYGNLFLIRKGRVVHMSTISGVVVDEPAEAQIVLGPVIAETERQFGKKK
jgi:hypothetical protein